VVHVLFYTVDASGAATLAVIGTDVRQTGHFVYSVRSGLWEGVGGLRWCARLVVSCCTDARPFPAPDYPSQLVRVLL